MNGITYSILNYRGGEVFKECLEAVKRQRHPVNYEIQVVDNSGELEESAEYKLVRADNKHGFITGVNESFRQAKYDLVFFLSYDVILTEDNVIFLIMGGKEIIQPIIYDQSGRIQNAGQRWVWPGYGLTIKKPITIIPMFTTTAFLMTKQAFQEIGYFDEQFAPAYYENVDYALRAKRLGYTFRCTSLIKARHYTSLAFSKRYSKREIRQFYSTNRKKLIRKHYRGFDRWSRLVALSAVDLARGLPPS